MLEIRPIKINLFISKLIFMVPFKISEQTIVIEENWDRCEREIERMWEEGFHITDFDYGDGVYHVVMSAGTGWGDQYLESGSDFPERKIDEAWDEGYVITNIAIDDEEWILVCTANVRGLGAQSWQGTEHFDDFEDTFHDAAHRGMSMTKMAYDDEDQLYIALLSENLGWEQQLSYWEEIEADMYLGGERRRNYQRQYRQPRNASHSRFSERFDRMGKGWDPDNRSTQEEAEAMVTDIIDHDGNYFFVESFDTPYREQCIHRREDWDDIDHIVQQRWSEGFFITTAAYIYDGWVLVFSR